MGLLQLPNELLNLIAGHLSVKEISNSSCCCRDLYTILTPTLYRRLRNDIDLFRWAIESGNDNVIRKLLEYGTNPDLSLVGFRIGDPQDFRGNPVALQDYQMQLLLLEQQNLRRRARGDRSYSPEVRFQRLWTPLHLAARMGRSDTVNLLLDHGANIKSLSHQFCKCNNLFHSAGPIANYAIPWWMPLHTAIVSFQTGPPGDFMEYMRSHLQVTPVPQELRHGSPTNYSRRPFPGGYERTRFI